MGRPAKKDKKEKEPLVIHERSEPFYKAFIFPEQNPDMIVDTSGDMFSNTPEEAIIALFESTPHDTLMRIPLRVMLLGEEEVDHDSSNDSPYAGNVVLLRLHANWDEEFENAKGESSEHEFMIRLKDLTAGYTTTLQDYVISFISMKATDPANPIFKVTTATLDVSDPDKCPAMMPKQIKI